MIMLEQGINRTKQLGCPNEVLKIINEFVEILLNEFKHQSIGVLLVGSASRGELSWQEVDGELFLFSDIEFLVAVEYKDVDAVNKVIKKTKEIEKRAGLGAFFHIDYTFIKWKHLKSLDTKFFIYESRNMGIDFCEKRVAQKLPVVSVDNLLWKELNEILIHRLSSILHAVPDTFFEGEMEKSCEQALCLSLAKNTLDLTTWLSPYESDSLIAGYENRLACWELPDFDTKDLSLFITKEDVGFIRQCLNIRRSPFDYDNPINMLRQTIDLYGKAIAYMKHINSIDMLQHIDSFVISGRLFDEYRFRQRVSEGVSLTLNVKEFGVFRYFKNLISVRRGFAARFCMLMLSSLVSYVDSGSGYEDLMMARDLLRGRIKLDKTKSAEFESLWSDTRNAFFQYQSITSNY